MSTTDPIASAWRWRHLEATGAPFTTWRPSRSNGLSTGGGGCADAALNRTPDTVRALGAGFGRGGRSDASATPRSAGDRIVALEAVDPERVKGRETVLALAAGTANVSYRDVIEAAQAVASSDLPMSDLM